MSILGCGYFARNDPKFMVYTLIQVKIFISWTTHRSKNQRYMFVNVLTKQIWTVWFIDEVWHWLKLTWFCISHALGAWLMTPKSSELSEIHFQLHSRCMFSSEYIWSAFDVITSYAVVYTELLMSATVKKSWRQFSGFSYYRILQKANHLANANICARRCVL